MGAYTTINDPSVHFQSTLYTGNGSASSYAITNTGNANLKPDFLWIKSRSIADNNVLFNSTAGVSKYLKSNGNDAETTGSSHLNSFNTDGFTLTTTDAALNQNSATYVSWQWKDNGGTTSSNSDGSITSTVQVNTISKFSIITYTGTGSATTVGHGLGTKPTAVFVKRTDGTANWRCFHQYGNIGNSGTQMQAGGKLNSTGAFDFGANSYWNNTSFSNTTLSLGTSSEVNGSGEYYVAYCFAEVQGYSKFGQYTAYSANPNSSHIYTGFKPAWLMIKSTSASAENWTILDATRDPFNYQISKLAANNNSAQSIDSNSLDLLSNGFKIRSNIGNWGASHQYVYWAFAQAPLVSSNNVPATAR
jgi:hypothetical protein